MAIQEHINRYGTNNLNEFSWFILLGMYILGAYKRGFKWWKFECKCNWERQEVWYGLFQMIGMISSTNNSLSNNLIKLT